MRRPIWLMALRLADENGRLRVREAMWHRRFVQSQQALAKAIDERDEALLVAGSGWTAEDVRWLREVEAGADGK